MAVENNYSNDLLVSGAFEAGNMAWGKVLVEAVGGSVTTTTVSGLNLQGTGDLLAFATAWSTVPQNIEGLATSTASGGSSFNLELYRTTSVDTWVHWFAIREVS